MSARFLITKYAICVKVSSQFFNQLLRYLNNTSPYPASYPLSQWHCTILNPDNLRGVDSVITNDNSVKIMQRVHRKDVLLECIGMTCMKFTGSKKR